MEDFLKNLGPIVLGALGLGGLLLFGRSGKPSGGGGGEPLPGKGPDVEGIDVSSHQGPSTGRRSERRASSSPTSRRPRSRLPRQEGSRQRARRHGGGIEVGSYHYLRVRSGKQDASEQALHYLGVFQELGCTLLPALDVETQGNEGKTYAEYPRRAASSSRSSRVRSAVPFLYTYPGFWANSGVLTGATDLARCPLWIAHYTKKAPTIPKPWTRATMWQYAAGAGVIGKVGGVKETSTETGSSAGSSRFASKALPSSDRLVVPWGWSPGLLPLLPIERRPSH